jgi:hypothetical protein
MARGIRSFMKTVRGMLGAGLVLAALAGCCLFPETATLIIQNDSSFEVDEVYISPVGSADRGENWLPAATTIPPGTSHIFRRITPGTYDVLIYDTEEGEWMDPGLDLPPGENITLTLVDSRSMVRVVNRRRLSSLRTPASRGCTRAPRTAA